MYEVNIYLESSIKGPGTREGWYGAVNEFVDKNQKIHTKESYSWEHETTYNRSILRALIAALKRMNASCYLNIYTDCRFVKSSIESNLERWKANDFVNAKGESIKNQEEYRELAKLLSGHKWKFHLSKEHSYTHLMWKNAEKLLKETKKSENCGKVCG